MRRGSILRLLIAAAILAGGWSTFASADTAGVEPRIALVIGNSAYGAAIGNLANPANDAKLMAATLRKVGFDVIELEDADRKAMSRAIVDFGEALAQKGGQTTGLFFYAGHGLQVAGENYLIPINADITREGDVETEALSSDLVLRQMDFAGNAVNIVILDACRNNPLSRGFRDVSRGLAEPRVKPRGSFIAYSTAPGDVAADGVGADSPYALALSQAILDPGAGIEEVFRDVRSRVLAATKQKQTPWDSSSLTAPFYFIPPTETAALAPTTPPPPSADKSVEVAYWNSIASSSNPALFQSYLKRFPNGDFTELAEAKLAELQAANGGEKSRSQEPPAADAVAIDELDATYVAIQSANIRAAPDTDAKIVARLHADDPVQATGKVKGKDWLRVESESGDGYVNATLLAPADANEVAEWRDLQAAPSADAADAFMKKHPDGYFRPKAEALLASLRPAASPESAPAANPAPAPEAPPPAQSFKDCTDCPELVSLPAGTFVMGAAPGEDAPYTHEEPQHRVTIARSFAVGKFEVTIGDFRAFVQATGYDAGNSCYSDPGATGAYADNAGMNWQNPGFPGYRPGGRDPVVCVSWDAARAYADWLSRKTGKHYRLLTEAEWEYAARAGTTTFFPWGIDASGSCAFANVADDTMRRAPGWLPSYTAVACDDKALFTVPAGRYRPNAFGLYDMIGNANEWVADCYAAGYAGAPTDGSAVDQSACQQRAVRGGGWSSNPYLSRSAARTFAPPAARLNVDGFRIARDL